jgi:hypothetical protein
VSLILDEKQKNLKWQVNLKKRFNHQMSSGDSIDMFLNLPDMASVA